MSASIAFTFLTFIIQELQAKKFQLHQLAQLTEIGLAQGNKSIIDATIHTLVRTKVFASVAVCKGNQTLQAIPYTDGACATPVSLVARFTKSTLPLASTDLEIRANYNFNKELRSLFGLMLMIVLTLAAFATLRKIERKVTQELLEPLSQGLRTGAAMKILELEKIRLELTESSEQKIQLNRLSERNKLAEQVAHDIRSPLGALKVFLGDAHFTDSEAKSGVEAAIERLRTIASDLAKRNELTSSSGAQNAIRIFPVLQNVWREKCALWRPYTGIDLTFTHAEQAPLLFVNGEEKELSRVFSNLLQNAFEALTELSGKVHLAMVRKAGTIQIQIRDTGKGIPPEQLIRLGERGFSFGKATGSGLGVSHAKATLASIGGTINYTSEEGLGTLVEINLPVIAPPDWFLSELKLTRTTAIFVVDDDPTIHQAWTEKLKLVRSYLPEIRHYQSVQAFIQSFREPLQKDSDFFVLMDLNFSGDDGAGLEAIKSLGIQKHSLLVTSDANQTLLQQRCAADGIRLLDKDLIGEITIQLT